MEMGHWVGVEEGGVTLCPHLTNRCSWNVLPDGAHRRVMFTKDSAEVCPRLLPTHGTEKCGRPHSQIIWCQNVGTSSKGSHVFPQALE